MIIDYCLFRENIFIPKTLQGVFLFLYVDGTQSFVQTIVFPTHMGDLRVYTRETEKSISTWSKNPGDTTRTERSRDNSTRSLFADHHAFQTRPVGEGRAQWRRHIICTCVKHVETTYLPRDTILSRLLHYKIGKRSTKLRFKPRLLQDVLQVTQKDHSDS